MFKFLRKTFLYILAVPVLITGIGIASNQLVLIANHDKFPVMINALKVSQIKHSQKHKAPESIIESILNPQPANEPSVYDPDGMLDDVHCVMTPDTHLNFLADVFDLGNTYSVGDFLLMLGEWLSAFAPFVWAFAVIRKLQSLD